ncbi:dihydrolipoyllysine-residue acetyltransferase [Chitinimonas taiwanensis]|uniref:Acetyltransferase component of pyruvate dehydrogenase complex n=1 Tax=Chitinimonas taiwanensis DSM 18899 TaxID=1121279 RepID=A0A1K2HNR0_9NEIS|nr:dihydrolipoyllysine-residue acetyltransferase [Chitinimonas taiwanensis]SFZ77882.1 pyruvate dehydrogenase E2 component (dihydrolipoamide acetyltransferase) [Chitinimonas taiwanensis DSM 18899]
MSNLIELKVPDIGDVKDVDVIEVFVKAGDVIKKDDSLITLETDKASMEVPAEAGGVVKEVRIKVGDKVSEGSLIVLIEAAGAAATAPVAAAPVAAPAPAPAPAAAPVAAASSTVEVKVPDIGDAKNVDVIEVFVKVGDTVKKDDSLITLETDKASMEVPSPTAGVVQSLAIKVGDKASEGTLILTLAAAGTAPVASPAAAPAPAAAAPAPTPAAAPVAAAAAVAAPVAAAKVDEASFKAAHASPSVRKFARELGVDLGKVKGSGPKGRIVASDVQAFVKSVMSGAVAAGPAPVNGSGVGLDLLPWPKVDFAKYGPVENKPLSRIKKISGANLARNWVMIPHVTQFDEADITEMEAFRKEMGEELKKQNLKITPLAFLIKAVVAALKKFPEFNSSLDGDNLVLKQYFHIGFAADTPNGLVVPVIRDADKKSLLELAAESGALAAKARDGKLLPAEMQGGCFSISSLGGVGGTAFTPIVNAPEVAILGVSKSSIKPVWNGSEFAPRLILPLSLSYDHRVIDGASAARFTTYLAQVLGDIRRLML